MNARHALILSAVAAVAIPSLSYGAAATIYDLGVQPGGTYSTAEAVSNINLGGGNWGAIGNQSDPTNGGAFGYFGYFPWSTLNTLQAGNVENNFGSPVYEFSMAGTGVNDSGISTSNWFDFGAGAYKPVVRDNNTNVTQQLSGIGGGPGGHLLAEDITNSGVIVGHDNVNAVVWGPAVVGSYVAPTKLDGDTAAGYQGTVTGQSFAMASNEAGNVIVGSAGNYAPAVWKGAGLLLEALPVTNAGLGNATDVNQSNVIVGGTGDDAVQWTPDGLGNYTSATSLGKLAVGDDVSLAMGINNHGLVVGYSGVRGADRPYTGAHDVLTGNQHFAALWDDTFGLTYGSSGAIDNMEAFVYDPISATLINIESLLAPAYASWDIAMALDINDANVVAAIAKDTAGDGLYHGVLIQVPEPGSLALLGLAGSLLGLRRRSR